jgi:hypothetical protein
MPPSPPVHAAVRVYADTRHLGAAVVERWYAWRVADAEALLGLAEALGLGGNQIVDIMTALEEIAARDGTSPAAVLAGPEIRGLLATRLGRADKIKRLKTLLRVRRYPRLTALERALEADVRALGLGSGVRVCFPPDLEGNEITVEVRARNGAALGKAVDRLHAAVRAGGFDRLFRRLDEGE